MKKRELVILVALVNMVYIALLFIPGVGPKQVNDQIKEKRKMIEQSNEPQTEPVETKQEREVRTSDLVAHAKREFALLNWPGNDEAQQALANNIIALLETFSKQKHNEHTAAYVLNVFHKLAEHRTLSPLTGEDSEWIKVNEYRLYQNKRDPTVFKENGVASCVNGIVFTNQDGVKYTCKDSVIPISFPWTRTEPLQQYRESAHKKSLCNPVEQGPMVP